MFKALMSYNRKENKALFLGGIALGATAVACESALLKKIGGIGWR